ncbi:MAG: FecR family protein [Gammaproteobacteria bacterium]|nr:FecR family protein [Gammaproteobacteria bacterium]NNF62609.1 FecR domain-containing protein [Gammaproteobacteria bacterium]NNM20509.1 FecR domain-containing protein [Gammaproteobacteria bacterium]
MNQSQSDKRTNDATLSRLLRLAGPRAEPAAAVRDEIYAAVHAEWQKQARTSTRVIVPLALAASLLAALVTAFWWLGSAGPQPDRFAGPAATLDRGSVESNMNGVWQPLSQSATLYGNQDLRTSSEPAGLVTTTGISVRMDRSTRLRFAGVHGITLEQGRIYVDTASQLHGDAAVEITTADGVIRDIGTQFEVAMLDGRTSVRVRDGEVIFNTEAEELSARRGESLTAVGAGAIARSESVTTGASWDWTLAVAPQFDTDGRRVNELIEWAARETGRELRYADALVRNAAAAASISGSVAGSGPLETLELALATTRLSYRLDDTVLTIDKR